MAGLTTVTSGGIADGTITNADINSSASIDASKVSGLSTDSITEGNTTVEVVDTGSDGHITFDTEGSEKARIDTSGRLLVGVTSAVDTGSTSLIQASSTGGARIALARNDTTTENTDSIGRIRWFGNDSDGNFDECARIDVVADADHSNDSKPSAITIHTTASSAASPTERMRIDSSGRLLVGATTAPTDTAGGLIQSVHSAGAQTVIGRNDSDVDDDDLIGRVGFTGFHNSSFKDSAAIEAAADADHAGNNRPGRLTFHTTGSSGNVTERMRIDSSGNVGIGTISPSQPLTVGGIARFENFVEFAGSISTPATAASIYRPADNQLAFGTASAERMRINASGHVGIGTNSPAVISGMSKYLTLSSTTADNAVGLELQGNRSGNDQTVARISFINNTSENARITVDSGTGAGANSNMIFATGGTTERMRLTSAGRLGIGTTTPSCALEVSGTGAVELPQGTTEQRPTAAEGMLRYNTSIDEFEYSNGSNWFQLSKGLTFEVDFLVIAGGGGGGCISGGGGGGAGGYQTSWGSGNISGGNTAVLDPIEISLSTTYTVTVGAGGAGSSSGDGSNGSDSVFATITSTGGGGGNRGGLNTSTGSNGGSGGGGGSGPSGGGTTQGGSGTANQGFDGGDGRHQSGVLQCGGGGGGAGEAGDDAESGSGSQAGDGGDGLASTITGSSVTRGGGGSGGSHSSSTTAGTAGAGGGGTGQTRSGTAATAGTANTGGGGGGAGDAPGGSGASGGSGVVILRYPSSLTATFSSGVTQTTSTVSSDKVSIITATSSTSETVSFA